MTPNGSGPPAVNNAGTKHAQSSDYTPADNLPTTTSHTEKFYLLPREDRELVILLGSVGIRVDEIVTDLLEDSLSHDEQIVFERQLAELAEGFRQRVPRSPIVIDGDVL